MTQFFFGSARPSFQPTELQAVILACNSPQLDPLTRKIPKPMLPIAGKPMIHYALQWIEPAGIKDILVVATQSCHQELTGYFRSYEGPRPELIFMEENMREADMWRKIKEKIKYDVLVLPVDSFPHTPLLSFLNRYRVDRPKAMVMAYPNEYADTLFVYAPQEQEKQQLLYQVADWKKKELTLPTPMIRSYPKLRLAPFQNAHIFLFSKQTWDTYMTDQIEHLQQDVFSPLLASQYPVPPSESTLTGWPCPNESIQIALSPKSVRVIHFASYLALNQKYAKGVVHPSADIAQRTQICPESMINQGTKLGDRCSVKKSVVGAHVQIGKNVKLVNTILMDHVILEDDVKLESCIVGHSAKIMEKCYLKDVIVCSKGSVAKEKTLRNEWIL